MAIIASGERGIGTLSRKEYSRRGGSGPAVPLPGGKPLRVVDEPTAVEAHFETDGAVRPRRFIWTQTWLDVSDVGRQWKSRSIRSTYSVLLDPRFSSQPSLSSTNRQD